MSRQTGWARRAAMALVLAGAAAFGAPGAALAQGAPETANLQLWTTRDVQQGSLPVIAARQGFFRENGLNVEVRFVSSGSEIPAGMAGGTIPIAVAAWTNPLSMVANGLGVRVLAQTTDISGILQMVVRPEANIRTARDLEGKRIGTTRIPLIMSLLERACAAYGCDMSRITLVNMQPQDLVLAYERGNVDGVLSWEPWAIYTEQRGGRVLFSATRSFIPGMEGERRVDGVYAAVFARTDFTTRNPRTTQAVLRALQQAADWSRANPDAAAEMVGREINIPVDVVRGTMSKIDNRLTMTAEWAQEFDRVATQLHALREIRNPVTHRDVFDPAPLRAVCAACVTVN
ncbi:ABC transporter substrate-binding protein [Falsiroseomonas sp. CW058]|uniref:ABC transporter substrate-binding protein n=1 Tax=Falsiroseomonas sp. CW058 TaxID=3388664 RepID=UPI003D324075